MNNLAATAGINGGRVVAGLNANLSAAARGLRADSGHPYLSSKGRGNGRSKGQKESLLMTATQWTTTRS